MLPTSFFSLPRELRDRIYNDFLYTPSDAPATPPDAGLRFKEEWQLPFISFNIFHTLDPRPHAYAFPLLHCNRQIRSEVQQMLSHAKASRDLACKLDCMLDFRNMFPTWTLCPCWPQNMRHLEIKFRLCNDWARANGCLLIYPAFRILNLLFNHGPQLGYSSSFRSADFHLKTLTLEIVCDEHVEAINVQMLNCITSTVDSIVGSSHVKWQIDRFVFRAGSLERIKETSGVSVSPRGIEARRWGFPWGKDVSFALSRWLDKALWVQAHTLPESTSSGSG